MNLPNAILHAALVMVGTVGFFYAYLALIFLWLWRREASPRVSADGELSPVTLLRPLKSGVPALREKLDALVAAMRPGDQLVLGVDAGSAEERVGADARAAFPEREIVVVACDAGVALNPKISKLIQMTPHARHGHWILSDSEALTDVAWLEGFRSEWLASGAEVLTAGYRFANLSTWPQRLDAASALLGLWPGLLWLRETEYRPPTLATFFDFRAGWLPRVKRIHFTLGACTGFRRGDIETVGGWAAFGDFLAEDNRIGAALSKVGCTIRLSAQVATLDSDPLTWRDYWRHQRRVAVTYRVCSPAGFAGMILTNGLVAIGGWLMLAALAPPSAPAIRQLSFIALVPLARWALSRGLGKMLRFPIPWLFPVMLVASAVELACWCAAWCDRRVWWAGRYWWVSRDGRLTPRELP